MLDGMIHRIGKEAGKKLTLIGTGEHIHHVAPYCENKFKMDENLLLTGLYLIYSKNKGL